MCGIFGIFNHRDAANLTYLGLHALQHRGQESAGISCTDGETMRTHREMGLVSDIFDAFGDMFGDCLPQRGLGGKMPEQRRLRHPDCRSHRPGRHPVRPDPVGQSENYGDDLGLAPFC